MDNTDIEVEAERIADQTQLSWREAVVMLADREGFDDGDICLIICRSQTTLKRVRRKIRRKQRNADRLEKTVEELRAG